LQGYARAQHSGISNPRKAEAMKEILPRTRRCDEQDAQQGDPALNQG